jgi:hypothetical protein
MLAPQRGSRVVAATSTSTRESPLVRLLAYGIKPLGDDEARGRAGDAVRFPVRALLTHPAELALLREDESLMPGAVEELISWSALTLISIPRYAREDVELSAS